MLVVVSLMLGALTAQIPDQVAIVLPETESRNVFFTPEDLDAIRRRAEEAEWAAEIRDSIVAEARAITAAELEIPHAGGQWTHYYTCREDGGNLKAKSPAEHVCQVCGKVWSGWPYDDVHVTHQHNYWLHGVETLGLAYVFDPDPAFAARARDILIEYAGFYRDLPLHDVNNESGTGKTVGRLYAQALQEAVMLREIVFGYSLLYDAAAFSPPDHEKIANGLLRPMTEVIRMHPRPQSNRQSWYNTACGCAGFLLRDRELIAYAINGEYGFLFQMKNSVKPGGMWHEGSPSYHWYALRAHVYLLEAAERAGMALYELPIVKKMFDAPIRQLFPDNTFPALQNSTRHSISQVREFYEVAWKQFESPIYLRFLQPRNSIWALFFGADKLEKPPVRSLWLTTSNSLSEGLAILRNGSGDAALYFDYSQGTVSHFHAAKLGIILYAHGEERIADPGCLLYGNPIQFRWYIQTLAHNSIVVDRESQRKAAPELLAFGYRNGIAVVRAKTSKAYSGVTLDRTIMMQGNLIVDVVQCTARRRRTFDLPFHFRGELADLPARKAAEPLGDANGYECLQEIEYCVDPLENFVVRTGEETRMHIGVHEASEAWIAKGYGATPSELLPVVLRRLHGDEAVFATVIQLLEKPETPRRVRIGHRGHPVIETGGITLEIGEETILRTGSRETVLQPDGNP
jgi:oligo-alginate lyase